jgi:hypothetical protein
MNVTVNQVLTMVGRLDDTPGFDTPRERFRRFLAERIIDPQAARLVIQQCQQMSGEQTHRALQDAVVLTGRFLGFHTIFSSYQHDPGAAAISGEWESRRRLHVILSLCTDQSAAIELEALSQIVRNGLPAHQPATTARVGVCIVSPLFAAKARMEEMLRARKHPELRLISLAGILRMADLVTSGRLTHDDVLQVLNPDPNLDSVLERLDRFAPVPRAVAEREGVNVAVREEDQLVGADLKAGPYWVAAIRLDPMTPAGQFVEAVIAKRRILPINPAPHVQRPIRPADSISVYITGIGFIAHAHVATVITDGSPVVRNADRFTQVLTLSDVSVYHTPIVAAQELARRIELTLTDGATAVATPISRQEFELATGAAALSEMR